MKKWLLLLIGFGLAVIARDTVFIGTDAAKLQPVQLLQVRVVKDGVRVETETGDVGVGGDLEAALEVMKKTTAGTVFLETVEFLLLGDAARDLIPELTVLLRPGCAVCIATEEPDLMQAAVFLSNHRPEVTLNDCRTEQPELPHLIVKEGRLSVEQS